MNNPIPRLREAFHAARHYPYLERAKQLVIETPAEIFALAGAGALLAGAVSYNAEHEKRCYIPLAFSEIETAEFELERMRGIAVPPLTRFYSVTNDVAMKVFEANNLSCQKWLGSGSDYYFARELEFKMDPAFRVHKLISDYAKLSPQYAQAALQSVTKLTEAEKDLPAVISALDEAWDYDRDDHYKTVYYTEEECSGTGQDRSCRMVTKSRQEYDYSTHTYTYDREAGVAASRLLNAFVAEHPDMLPPEALLQAHKTGAENEWAIDQSRRNQNKYNIPRHHSQEEYLAFTNTWATGSNYNVLMPRMAEQHTAVKGLTPRWQAALPTARYHSYNTYSRSDSGPAEYQVAEAALDQARGLQANSQRITGGIRMTATVIPQLSATAQRFIDAELHGGEGDPSKLRREVMKQARDIYDANYAGGFDVRPAKYYMIFVWGLLGGLLGAGLGFGADKLVARRWPTYNGHLSSAWRSMRGLPERPHNPILDRSELDALRSRRRFGQGRDYDPFKR